MEDSIQNQTEMTAETVAAPIVPTVSPSVEKKKFPIWIFFLVFLIVLSLVGLAYLYLAFPSSQNYAPNETPVPVVSFPKTAPENSSSLTAGDSLTDIESDLNATTLESLDSAFTDLNS